MTAGKRGPEKGDGFWGRNGGGIFPLWWGEGGGSGTVPVALSPHFLTGDESRSSGGIYFPTTPADPPADSKMLSHDATLLHPSSIPPA